MRPRFPLRRSLLLLGAWLLLSAPARAQHMFLDATGDGVHDSADVLNPTGPTTFDIWIRTDQNRDGSLASCVTEDGELTINSYEFTLRVTNGEVVWGAFTNHQSLFIVDLGSGSSSTEFHIGFGGGSILPRGTYRLGSLSASPLTGTPGLEFSETSTLSGVFLTSFGSRCSGTDFDNTLKLGQDWHDTDGLAFGGLVNHPPVLQQPENMVAVEDQVAEQALHATDQDGAPLMFQKIDGPPFMDVQTVEEGSGAALGRIRLTPGPRHAGTYFAAIGVSDGVFQDRRDLQIQVVNVNHPPTLHPIENIRMTAGDVEIPFIRMFDPDGDALTLQILARPLYVSIQHFPGETLTFAVITPSLSDAGRTDTVRLAVTDGEFRDEKSFTITVQSRPALAIMQDITLPASSYSEQNLIATDADGDPLEFSKVSGPAFVRVETLDPGTGVATGRLELRPGPLDVGWSRVLVGVSDGMATHDRAIQVAVTTPNGNPPHRADLMQSNFLSFDAVLSPRGIASDDLNGDGHLDIVVSDESWPVRLTLLLGNGDGSFRWHTELETPDSPTRVKIADLDRDGHADLILPTQSQWLSVYLGYGDGTFQPRVDYPIPGHCHDIAVTDLDGDGDPDVLAPSVSAGTLQVFLNVGGGVLVHGEEYAVGSYASSIATGDLNRDGAPDVILSSYSEGTVSVFRGNGDGTLQLPTSYPVGPYPRMVLVNDVNGDGNADVAVAAEGLVLLLGDGHGLLTRSESDAPGGPMVLHDFDRDGTLDLAVAGFGSHLVHVFRGTGNGAFVPTGVLPTGAAPVALLAADLDLDGWADLVTANAGTVSVLFGRAGGAFMTAPSIAADHRPTQVHAAALDDNPNIDLVTVGSDPSGISLWLSAGNLEYVAGPPIPIRGAPRFAALADWNADAVLDLAYSRFDQAIVTVHMGLGGGVFGQGVDIPLSFWPTKLHVADTNQDSRPDLVLAPNYVLLNSGNGSFTPVLSQLQAGDIMAIGLFDGDSYPDVVSTWGNGILLSIGRGDGTFVSRFSTSTDLEVTSMSTSDWDRDGRSDLAVATRQYASPGPGTILIFRGLGDGTFSVPVLHPGVENPTGLNSVDWNGDGHVDLLVSSGSTNTVSVLLSNGNGTFAPKVDYGTGASPASISVADVDGDQRPDAVTADNLSRTITVLRNTSSAPNRPPIADGGGPYRGIRGVPVPFSAQRSSDPDGEPLSFRWDFGDGKSGTGAALEHTYNDAGSYRVTMEVPWARKHHFP